MHNVLGLRFSALAPSAQVGGTKMCFRLGRWVDKECIVNDKDGFPVILRFGNVVGGLPSSLHPFLGFDQGPCLDTGCVCNASAWEVV